jgi:transposase-like protein
MNCDHCGSSNLIMGTYSAKCKDCKRKTVLERIIKFFAM